MNKPHKPKDGTPLSLNSFSAEFNNAGSTIKHAGRFVDHARQILADEGNLSGLFALDLMLKNKEGQYRDDDVTPKANHPLLVFFQIHIFHQNDQDNPKRSWKYLPDRPDLDKVLALMHDEGEDHKKNKPEDIRRKFNAFLNNIDEYIDDLNRTHPEIDLRKPSQAEIERMRKDMDSVLKSFHLLSRKYKGEEKRVNYHKNHEEILEDARATRIKLADKACNAATFVYRNRKLTALVVKALDLTEYREWVFNQIHKLHDLYFIQPFGFKRAFNDKKSKVVSGFIQAAKKKHPENGRYFSVMKGILKTQLELYSHNIANEKIGHGSPQLRRRTEKYDSMCFARSINVIDILINRLEEVVKIDNNREKRDPNKGLFGIPFKRTNS